MLSLPAILQLLGLVQQIVDKGLPAWLSIKAALAANGIDADTAELDKVIADADRRRQQAEAEADSTE